MNTSIVDCFLKMTMQIAKCCARFACEPFLFDIIDMHACYFIFLFQFVGISLLHIMLSHTISLVPVSYRFIKFSQIYLSQQVTKLMAGIQGASFYQGFVSQGAPWPQFGMADIILCGYHNFF